MRDRDIQRLEGAIGATLGALASAGPAAVLALVATLYALAFLFHGASRVSWADVAPFFLWCGGVALSVFAARLVMRELKASRRAVRGVTLALCLPLIVPFEVSTRAIEGLTGVSYRMVYYRLTGTSSDDQTDCARMRDSGWIHDGTERSVLNALECVGHLEPAVLERSCRNFVATGKPFEGPALRAFCARWPGMAAGRPGTP